MYSGQPSPLYVSISKHRVKLEWGRAQRYVGGHSCRPPDRMRCLRCSGHGGSVSSSTQHCSCRKRSIERTKRRKSEPVGQRGWSDRQRCRSVPTFSRSLCMAQFKPITRSCKEVDSSFGSACFQSTYLNLHLYYMPARGIATDHSVLCRTVCVDATPRKVDALDC